MIYKDLEVWKLGMELVIETNQVTTRFPKEELFGLASQSRLYRFLRILQKVLAARIPRSSSSFFI